MAAPRKPLHVFECPSCGKAVTRARNRWKKNKKKFCSISCATKMQLHPKDFGAGFIDKHGYRLLKRTGRYTPEHRLVMEEKIGRKLMDFESVHHINGQRLDNRPENLEIWSGKHPPGQRVRDKIDFALETLALYPNEAREACLWMLPGVADPSALLSHGG